MTKSISSVIKKIFLLPMFLFATIFVWAQDKKVDVNINTKGDSGNFFAQPWIWVIGGAVFIIILVALLRGKK
jgi:hypothetical protein